MRRASSAAACFDFSNDAQKLVLDRFEIATSGTRLGFDDIAALMGWRGRVTLRGLESQGGYQALALQDAPNIYMVLCGKRVLQADALTACGLRPPAQYAIPALPAARPPGRPAGYGRHPFAAPAR